MLNVTNLTVRYGDLTIVNDVSFSVKEGEWLMIVGPNGAGKSTIVSAISQGVTYSGTISLNGQDIRKMKPNKFAQELGVLAQKHFVTYSFTVEEVVRLGRYCYNPSPFAEHTREQEDFVAQALEKTGLLAQREQSVLTLSGGELQRTFLAQLFAQNPHILMLDEPTNHLDLVYQKQVFQLIQDWLSINGRAVVSVVHDLSLAKAYGSKILLLDKGRVVDYGNVENVLSPENLKKVYSMDVYAWMQEMLSQWS